MKKIRLAIAGLGNCASSLIQGIEYYKHTDEKECVGLMHYDISGYRAGDIDVVAAFDIDARKVGHDISEAIFALPNCTKVFHPDVPRNNVEVKMGPVLDGVAPHMLNYPDDKRFVVADAAVCDVRRELENPVSPSACRKASRAGSGADAAACCGQFPVKSTSLA